MPGLAGDLRGGRAAIGGADEDAAGGVEHRPPPVVRLEPRTRSSRAHRGLGELGPLGSSWWRTWWSVANAIAAPMRTSAAATSSA